MRNILLDRLRKSYRLPSKIDLPSTPFPSQRTKGSRVPGSSKIKASLWSRIPDITPREKSVLSLPESKVETNIISDYTKKSKPLDSKNKLDGPKLNEDVIFDSFKTLQKRLKSKTPTKKKKEKKKEKKKKSVNKERKETKFSSRKVKLNINPRSKHFDVIS